jgi:LacI family transcriptional regulator
VSPRKIVEPKARAVRLKDVATETGLSEAAVSRYLNRTLNLPAETRTRIDEAVARLGYRANPNARSLSRGRSDQIGLVIPDLANPFFAQMAATVERAADARGLGLLLCMTSNRRERELDYIRRLHQHQIDGLLLLTNHADDGSIAGAINAAGDIVLLDEDVAGTDVPKIFADNEQGGWLAVSHLIEHGHRSIALISGPDGLMSTDQRAAGARRAIAATAGACVTMECRGEYSRAHGSAAAAALLGAGARTTAVFTANDEILVGLLEVFHERGVRVPDDMSVITFDDVETLHLFAPAISAVRQDVAGMGQRAVQVLTERRRPPDRAPRTELIAVELVPRASVGPPRRGP